MKVLLIVAAAFAAAQADISEILRGGNAVYGQYYHDDGGRYVHDTSGHYVHSDNPYVHNDNPYLHQGIPPVPYQHDPIAPLPYQHDPVPHVPYEHDHIPHLPYEHDHVPHQPYLHVDNPYEHAHVPHVPYEHVDNPYVHEATISQPSRAYLPQPPPPEPAPYVYNKPVNPIVTIRPRPVITTSRPLRPAASTIRPYVTAKPTAAARGSGPYRWNLFSSGEHGVEHPEYNLQTKLHPH